MSPVSGDRLELVRTFVNTFDTETDAEDLDDPEALIAWLDAATDAVRNRQAPPPLPEFGPNETRWSETTRSEEIAPPPPRLVTRHAETRPSVARRPKINFTLRGPTAAEPARPVKQHSVIKTSEPRVNLGEFQVQKGCR